ncbi:MULTISPECIES: hypothetical protein [Nostocales]|uniref:Uncharacterized protein n=1 Tax=Tolypothrix campylonemoides VB511288_2 TaxID=3232311 RepID=A0ABW8XN53_9CYAN
MLPIIPLPITVDVGIIEFSSRLYLLRILKLRAGDTAPIRNAICRYAERKAIALASGWVLERQL